MLLILAAFVYAIVFWAVTWRRPDLALLSVFALAPFQNDLSTGGPVRFSIAEVNLLLSVPVFILRRRPVGLGVLTGPVLAYLTVCLFSSALNWRSTALNSLLQIVIYLVVAVIVFRALPRDIDSYRPVLFGLVWVCAFIAAMVLIHRNGYVLGLHKNGTGGSLACGTVVCAELWFAERNRSRKKWLLAALLLIGSGTFFTLSRGAWLTTVTGLAVILAFRCRFMLLLRAAAVLAPLAAVCWNYLPNDSREYAAGFDRTNFNIQARFDSIDYAMDLFQKNPLTGVGVGLRKEYDATNVVLLTLAETGVPGLIAFLAIHLAVLWIALDGRRYVRPEGLGYSLLAIAIALVIGKMMHGLVDHYWSRGDTMIAWASAGMGLRAVSRTGRSNGQLPHGAEGYSRGRPAVKAA